MKKWLIIGRSRLLVPPTSGDGGEGGRRGVGVLTGRDDLAVLAWSDVGPPAPKVHVYQYNHPHDVKTMLGRSDTYLLIAVLIHITRLNRNGFSSFA